MELDYNPYDDTPADLEVFIYLKESGPESLGHVDISFKNRIYSYGCHDPENRELFGTLGDGVLIVSDRNSFLENAIQNDEKTIIGYKIELTENQKAIIQKKIDNLKLEIEKIDNAIEKIQEGFIFGLYDANEGKQLKMKQEEKIEKLEEELSHEIQSLSKLSNRDSLDRLSRVNRFLEDVKNENDPEVLNKIYKNIISEIVIDIRARDEIDITVNFL